MRDPLTVGFVTIETHKETLAKAEKLAAALERLESMVRIMPPDMDAPGSALEQARAALREFRDE